MCVCVQAEMSQETERVSSFLLHLIPPEEFVVSRVFSLRKKEHAHSPH